jgi:hypothetical protein
MVMLKSSLMRRVQTPPKLYAGPAIPIEWDPNWQTYTNLTKAQIAAFQAMPQDLTFYVQHKSWLSAEPPPHTARSSDAATAQSDYISKVTAWHTVLADLHAKINSGQVTTRVQIKEALKAATSNDLNG